MWLVDGKQVIKSWPIQSGVGPVGPKNGLVKSIRGKWHNKEEN